MTKLHSFLLVILALLHQAAPASFFSSWLPASNTSSNRPNAPRNASFGCTTENANVSTCPAPATKRDHVVIRDRWRYPQQTLVKSSSSTTNNSNNFNRPKMGKNDYYHHYPNKNNRLVSKKIARAKESDILDFDQKELPLNPDSAPVIAQVTEFAEECHIESPQADNHSTIVSKLSNSISANLQPKRVVHRQGLLISTTTDPRQSQKATNQRKTSRSNQRARLIYEAIIDNEEYFNKQSEDSDGDMDGLYDPKDQLIITSHIAEDDDEASREEMENDLLDAMLSFRSSNKIASICDAIF